MKLLFLTILFTFVLSDCGCGKKAAGDDEKPSGSCPMSGGGSGIVPKNRVFYPIRFFDEFEGAIDENNFELKVEDIRDLNEGEVLLANQYFSFDPSQVGWYSKNPIEGMYRPLIPQGAPMEGFGIGRVILSKNDNYKAGDLVSTVLTWSDYSISSCAPNTVFACNPVNSELTPQQTLSVFGLTGLTAWVGLKGIGKVKEGEVVLVSTAAGAVGNVVGQLAANLGATVIGITSSDKKVELLKSYGYHHTINYNTENIEARLKEIAPNGIDFYFDNVGDYQLQAAINALKPIVGRIALCGQAATYRSGGFSKLNLLPAVLKSVNIYGFMFAHFSQFFPEAIADMSKQLAEGKLKIVIDEREGFENLPKVFGDLWRGQNSGKLLLKL